MKRHTRNFTELAKYKVENKMFPGFLGRCIRLFSLLGMALILIACTAVPVVPTSIPTFLPTPTSMDATACPNVSEGTQLLTNEEYGYCLLYSDGYTRVDPLPEEVCLVLGDSSMACHSANLIIQVENAAGRALSQIADEMIAEAETAAPGIEIQRTDLTLSDEQAIMLEGIPGVDASRIVVLVHADRLYKLTFAPWDETRGEFAGVENLYNMVVNSFTFLP